MAEESDYSSSVSEVEEEGAPLNARAILEARAKKFKSAIPDKPDDLVHDVGNLCAFDYSPIDEELFQQNPQQYLDSLGRDNAQLLLNRIFQLPTIKRDDGVFAEMPRPETPIPREKPLPKPKAETKWEKFAKQKGIRPRAKRSRMAYDEATDSFLPRYGYKSAKNDDKRQWIIEEKSGEQRTEEDPFLQKRANRRKAVKKQQKQEKMNAMRAQRQRMKRKFPGKDSMAVLKGKSLDSVDRQELRGIVQTQLAMSKKATASIGRFSKAMAGEPKMKRSKTKKRPVALTSGEKAQQQRTLDRILGKEKKEALNVKAAVNRHLRIEQRGNRRRQ